MDGDTAIEKRCSGRGMSSVSGPQFRETFDDLAGDWTGLIWPIPPLPAGWSERVIRAAQFAGAHEFILQLPLGYDTVLEERGSNLSGGQRQRIAIARALATVPRILILDEATAALDYESERTFQENMKAVEKNRTVLIIAHRLSTIKNADRIIVMDHGQIVEQGTHEELLAVQGIYWELNRDS